MTDQIDCSVTSLTPDQIEDLRDIATYRGFALGVAISTYAVQLGVDSSKLALSVMGDEFVLFDKLIKPYLAQNSTDVSRQLLIETFQRIRRSVDLELALRAA